MNRLFVIVGIAFSLGCEPRVASPGDEHAESSVVLQTSTTGGEKPIFPPELDIPECTALEGGMFACPSTELLQQWGAKRHQAEPTEETLVAALDPADPVEIRDGLELYDDLLNGVVRQTRSHLELWANTPPLSDTELALYGEKPDLWKQVVDFRSASKNEQIAKLRKALRAKDREALRSLVLRNGVFFLEDPAVAGFAGKYIALHHLFDSEEVELQRSGLTYLLRKGNRGHYYHFEPALDEAEVTFHLFDRVGLPGSLEPLVTYDLHNFRRTNGLSNLEVDAETPAGRPAKVRFFDGTSFDGLLALTEKGPQLAVLAPAERLTALRAANVEEREIVCRLLATADTMVGERLDFDEPKVEYGQQDGYLRWRFDKAIEAGKKTYSMNGVTYQVYDKEGRPRVPQLCIDFVTDAVERMQGTWPAKRGEPQEPQPFDIREYMRFRTVRNLIALAQETPQVAEVLSLPRDQQVPYRERSDFFENLWNLRADVRDGDVLVIYGLRADNRNHFHSFYVRETDPVYGVPTVLAANPGFARIQAWHDVMWESPKRSVRHRVRWNPDWLNAPQAVDAAVSVIGTASTFASPAGE